MLTNNYYRCIASALTNKQSPKYTALDGSTQLLSYSTHGLRFGGDSYGEASMSKVSTNINSSNSVGAVFGDGNTPPTAEDYKLSGNYITSGFKYTAALSYNFTDADASITATYTITNTSEAPILIKEVGLIAALNEINTANNIKNNALIDRTVRDTPVTIPAGGIGQVVYTITFNYPTTT